VILESIFAEITVCEYCGMVSISISPRDEYPELAEHWCEQVIDGITEILLPYELYYKQFVMSNGVSVFMKGTP